MNPLDRLTEVISRLMGKEPSDPDVLEAVVEVVMVMREPSREMLRAAEAVSLWLPDEATHYERDMDGEEARRAWQAMIDALLTEGEG